jgi:Ser/Thr protein kinase RdoA (MazF antagonist)
MLDFGCINFDPRVFDLAIFLATFCFDEKNWTQKFEILEEIRYGYLEPLRFTDREIAALPVLVKAVYSVYLLNSNKLLQDGDASDQTEHWFNLSVNMLRLLENWT